MIKKKLFIFILYLILNELIYHKKIKKRNLKDFFKIKDQKNSVFIALYEKYHLECLPGFIKYFNNLKYKVDLLINSRSIESIGKMKLSKYIRIFQYKNLTEILNNLKLLKKIILNYKFLFLITLEKSKIKFYKDLGYYEHPNSLFIIHHINELYSIGLKRYILQNKVFSLLDTGKILYLNPCYFGKFKCSFKKNKIPKFFITSTKHRNYNHFLKGIYYLKNNSIDFEIYVVGRSGKFGINNVPKELRNYFHFYNNITYQKMFKIIIKSDFIILNLYPNRTEDIIYKIYRATGNAQISYGFCKPSLVENSFSSIYKFSNNNSIIYNNNNIHLAMMEAAKMTNKKYINLCKNLNLLRKNIYKISLNNLKNILNKYK